MWYQYVVLRPGAYGPAVAAARRRLHRLGYDVADIGQQFDEDMSRAVAAFQEHRHLTPDGVIGPATWRCLYGRDEESSDVVYLSPGASPWVPEKHRPDGERAAALHISVADRRLSLHTTDGSVHTFSVAVGRDGSPTPPGRYTVRDLLWGPGPPLGTRWIRLHPDTCDIHGTDEPWTIGQAVTPGCIRLYNKDVEFVFHRLVRATPVLIE